MLSPSTMVHGGESVYLYAYAITVWKSFLTDPCSL